MTTTVSNQYSARHRPLRLVVVGKPLVADWFLVMH